MTPAALTGDDDRVAAAELTIICVIFRNHGAANQVIMLMSLYLSNFNLVIIMCYISI